MTLELEFSDAPAAPLWDPGSCLKASKLVEAMPVATKNGLLPISDLIDVITFSFTDNLISTVHVNRFPLCLLHAA